MSSFNLTLPSRLKPEITLNRSHPARRPGRDEAGFQAGYREGLWQAQSESRKLHRAQVENMKVMRAKLARLQAELVETIEKQFPDLLLEALKKVLHYHVFTTEEIGSYLKTLVGELREAHQIRIECSPDDLEALKICTLSEGRNGVVGIEWKANPALQPAEFVVESDLGMMEGRRQSRLARFKVEVEEGS
jgi:flagellar biosynthesis/type III secretory pathway protein FliH